MGHGANNAMLWAHVSPSKMYAVALLKGVVNETVVQILSMAARKKRQACKQFSGPNYSVSQI